MSSDREFELRPTGPHELVAPDQKHKLTVGHPTSNVSTALFLTDGELAGLRKAVFAGPAETILVIFDHLHNSLGFTAPELYEERWAIARARIAELLAGVAEDGGWDPAVDEAEDRE